MSTRMRELEMKEGKPSSKSLLANVLDMDDDFRYVFLYILFSYIGLQQMNVFLNIK